MPLFGSKKTDPATADDTSSLDKPEKKPSLYARFQDKKRGPGVSDEDVQKYLGMSKEELMARADNTPGVGKNQLAGKINNGPASGLGGSAAAGGFGGWGPGAEPGDAKNRGMKFPPENAA